MHYVPSPTPRLRKSKLGVSEAESAVQILALKLLTEEQEYFRRSYSDCC